MGCYPIRNGIVCISDDYKPGDPEPDGYIARIDWATVQHKAGIRQLYCWDCGKMYWNHPNLRRCNCPSGTPVRGVKNAKMLPPETINKLRGIR